MPPLFDALQKLPSAVRDHLYSGDLEAWYSAAQDRWALPDDQRPEVEAAALDVYLRERTLDQFITRLGEFIGDADRAKAIAIEILGNDFLKIEDYLGIDIPAYIKHLGGDPSKFVKEIPVADVAAGIMTGIGVAPLDPVIAKRVEHAVTSFLTGIRDQLETKDVLTRGTKVGGVGLDASTAERIVTALTAQLRELQQAGIVIRRETEKPPEASTFHLVKASKSSVMQPEDEAEIEQIRRKVIPGDAVGDRIRAAVDRIIQKTGAKFKSDDVSRRFRTAIESRVRDIRDRQETLDLLTRPPAQGGFGIPKEQVEKVLRVAEEEARGVHARTDGHGSVRMATDSTDTPSQAQGLKPKVSSPAPTTPVLPPPPPVATLVHPVPPAAVERAGSRAAEPVSPPPKPAPSVQRVVSSEPREPRDLDRDSSTPSPAGSVARNDEGGGKPAPPPVPSKPQADSPKPQATPPPIIKQIPIALPPTKPQAPPPVPPLGVSLRPGASGPEGGGKGELPPDRNPSPPPRTLRGGATMVPPPSVIPSGKPKLQDIRPVAPRLVGPIEELQQLTLTDFRKIAKSPADAATRIVEKLALLEKDSFTKRAEGVKALRGSPLMVVYAEVMNAALMAKRSAEAEVKERLAKDRGALTLEEFRALQNLNTQIRH